MTTDAAVTSEPRSATTAASPAAATRCRVVVLTFNSARIVEATLAQALRIDPRPFVVDSFSTDDTVPRARALGCEVVQRPFRHYADQRNWAIGQLAAQAHWQLHLDADEVLDDAAVTAIGRALEGDPPADAYLLRRVDYFMGRRLRFSGLNPWHLRLFRSGAAVCEDRLYDQHFVARVPARRLPGCMHDRNEQTLADWTARHNRWSDLEAQEIVQRALLQATQLAHAATGGRLQARLGGDPRERTRWLKQLYYRTPAGLRAVAYFGYRYLLRGGFLDGREGLYFAFLQGLWFRMLVDAKVAEARQRLRGGAAD